MATTEKAVRRGFDVDCIRCGCRGAEVWIELGDVTEFTCSECEQTFTVEDVRRHLGGWEAVLAWVEMAPAVEG